MRVARAAAGILILSASTVWAQSTPPVTASAGGRAGASRMVMAGPPSNKMTSVQAAVAQKRMQEMESTLKAMHLLLKQMRDKAAKSKSQDPFAKANLEMWQLMLGHLDQQFNQLRATTLAREDLNARRAALYKQAEAKAALEAEAARAANTSSAAATGTAEQGTAAVSAGQAAAGATAAHDEAQATSAPASSTPK
jgi:hypothetical protein